MSAREELEYLFTSTMASCDAIDAVDTLDAYKAEVLREAAAKIRYAGGISLAFSEHLRGMAAAADLIDPDKEN